MSDDIKTDKMKDASFTDSGKELLDEETVKKAIDVLESALKVFEKKKKNSFKLFDKLKERRSGKERRKDLLMPYWRAFLKKMLENFSSAKMIIFFFPLFASIFFLWILFGMRDEYLEFAAQHPTAVSDVNEFFKIAMNGFISWCTFTVSLGGTIIVVRETFKVSKLKALKSGDDSCNEEIDNMQN